MLKQTSVFVLVLLGLAFGNFGVAHAVNSAVGNPANTSAPAVKAQVREAVQAKVTAVKEAVKVKRATIKKAHVINYASRSLERLNRSLMLQANFMARIESRIMKFEQAGQKDVTEAKNKHAEAIAAYQSALGSMGIAQTEAENAANSTADNGGEKVREAVQAALQSVKNVHASIVETVKVLKGLVTTTTNATSTVETVTEQTEDSTDSED